MGRIWFLAMAFFSLVTVAVAAEEEGAKQPNAPAAGERIQQLRAEPLGRGHYAPGRGRSANETDAAPFR